MNNESRRQPDAGLNGIQRHLEIHPVDQFLTTDADLACRLDDGTSARESLEKLLLREEEDGVAVALYIDAATMAVLSDNDPLRSLNEGNLGEFLTVLEGVSHFLYLIWNARHGRSVSLFELELQAEVDKFAVAALLLARQQRFRVPWDLHERLFATPIYDDRLDRNERRRYHAANDYAARYCARLRRECLQERRISLVRELRRFYRLTSRHKLEHIARSQ